MNEQNFIRKLRSLSKDKSISLNFSDDAAILKDFIITKDILIENIHFKYNNNISAILHKAITANVSDISAMGGYPRYILAGFGINDKINENEFVYAFEKALKTYKLDLIGGDISKSDNLFISITAIGIKNRFILSRSGAKPSDILFLSKEIGKSVYYLQKELNGENVFEHYYVKAETELGAFLGTKDYITSCTDISDGLGIDANSIAEASKVRIIIFEKELPIFKNSRIDEAISSGEEYALLFTVKKEKVDTFLKETPKKVYKIGEVKEGGGVFIKTSHHLIDISNKGYIHRL